MDQDIGPLGSNLASAPAKGRLLVVEDDNIFRFLLQEVLHPGRWTYRFSASLAEAAVELAHWRPDLVLTDLHLPDGRGGEAVRRLLAEGAPSVLAMTGAPDAPDALDALAAGAVACLTKDGVEHQLAPWLGT